MHHVAINHKGIVENLTEVLLYRILIHHRLGSDLIHPNHQLDMHQNRNNEKVTLISRVMTAVKQKPALLRHHSIQG